MGIRKEKKRVFRPLERWLLASWTPQDPGRVKAVLGNRKEGEILNPRVGRFKGRFKDREGTMSPVGEDLKKKEEDLELGLNPGQEKENK